MLWLLACTPGAIVLPDTSTIRETGAPDTGGPDTSVPPPDPPDLSSLALTVDDTIVTLVHASWADAGFESAQVEYRFEGEDWSVAPAIAAGDAAILGIPFDTEVEARLAVTVDGYPFTSDPVTALTGTAPEDVLLFPTIDAWDPDLAYDAGYVMVSVGTGDWTFGPPFTIEIFDRRGRVVWYHVDDQRMMIFYPTVSRDGTHIWYDGDNVFGIGKADPFVTRRTLDGRWEETLPVPDMGQAVAEGPDGSFFYEQRTSHATGLRRIDPDGTVTDLWSCGAWAADHGLRLANCWMNTCNWDETRNTVLASMFESSTVFEIDLATGEPIRQMGQLTVGDPYTFDPPESMFDYQHDAYWTEAGTLLASTHVQGRSGVQVAAEYAVDDATRTLTRVWSYASTDLWATQLGEAVRLPNGNTLQGYGQDGAIREVTSDGDVAWQASFERDASGYRVIGHATLIPDLYALNVGPAAP